MACPNALLQARQQLGHKSCTRISKTVNQSTSFVNISDELGYFIIVSGSKYKSSLISMSFRFPIQKREIRMLTLQGGTENELTRRKIPERGTQFDFLSNKRRQNFSSLTRSIGLEYFIKRNSSNENSYVTIRN